MSKITNKAQDSAEFKVEYDDSNRKYDNNGYLHIENCVLTKEEVSDYLGKSITHWKMLNLDPNKTYGLYRPIEEIEKAFTLYNDLPLTDDHIEITPINPKREKWFGHSGSLSRIEDGKLYNKITVLVKKAIDEIELATKNPGQGRKDLSIGYVYDLVPEEGTFGGKKYDFVMRNIRPNHVALVKEGRVNDAKIADSKNFKGITKMKFNMLNFLKGFAKDSKEESKAYDEGHLREIGKGIIAMAKDEDYEGKEDKLLDEITGVLSELHKVQKEEKESKAKDNEEKESKAKDNEEKESKAKDNEEKESKAKDNEEKESKAKDNEEKESKAKDNEEKESKAKDNEEKESKANDSKDFAQVVGLSQKVIGRLNPDLIMQGKSAPIMDKVLKAKGIAFDSMNHNEKLGLLKNLANSKKSVPNFASDSKTDKVLLSSKPMFNPLNRKGN